MTTIAQEYIQEGIQLGLEQGLKQGIENLQDSTLDLLAIRLSEVNEEVAERLTAVTDMPRLRQLLWEAATAVTMTAFAERLDELTQED